MDAATEDVKSLGLGLHHPSKAVLLSVLLILHKYVIEQPRLERSLEDSGPPLGAKRCLDEIYLAPCPATS